MRHHLPLTTILLLSISFPALSAPKWQEYGVTTEGKSMSLDSSSPKRDRGGNTVTFKYRVTDRDGKENVRTATSEDCFVGNSRALNGRPSRWNVKLENVWMPVTADSETSKNMLINACRIANGGNSEPITTVLRGTRANTQDGDWKNFGTTRPVGGYSLSLRVDSPRRIEGNTVSFQYTATDKNGVILYRTARSHDCLTSEGKLNGNPIDWDVNIGGKWVHVDVDSAATKNLLINTCRIANGGKSEPTASKPRSQQPYSISLDSTGGYFNSGNSKFKFGDFQGAISDYTQAIKFNSNNEVAYLNRAISRSKTGDFLGAIDDCNQAISINPNYERAYLMRGIYKAKEDTFGALNDFTKVIDINSANSKAYDLRAGVKVELGDKQGAIDDYTQAINIDHKNASAYTHRGYIKTGLGDKQGAIDDCTQAININPKDDFAYFVRAMNKSNIGDKRGAIDDMIRASNLSIENGDKDGYQLALKYINMWR